MRAWSEFMIAVSAAAIALVSPAFAKNLSPDWQVRKMERYNARSVQSAASGSGGLRVLPWRAVHHRAKAPIPGTNRPRSRRLVIGETRGLDQFTRHVPHLSPDCERRFERDLIEVCH
jgi:hypothetical protein